jgi:outer membrane lipoprotein-sorting protein
MHFKIKIMVAATLALTFLAVPAAHATPASDLKSVLDRLNTSAANFQTMSADVEFDDITTDPIYDKDVFKGLVYYDRKGAQFRMGVHFKEHNGKPSTKAYTYLGGVLKLHESGSNQVTSYPQAGKFESYLLLGFGASGRDLETKWDIKYLGAEPIDGISTEKLELVAKDPEVRKNLAKVTIWVDPDRAVSLKQIFTLNAMSSKVCFYKDFKLNKSLPGDAFTFKAEQK